MAIVKVVNNKSKIDGYKIVGVIFPKKVYTYFSLFVLAKGITKSIPIKEQMQKWYDRSILNEPENELIDELVGRIKREWAYIKKRNPDMLIASFKTSLKIELRKKGLQDNYIETILSKIEQ